MTDEAVAATDNPDIEADGGAEGGAKQPSGRMPGKKLVLFIILPILLLIGGGGGVYFSGVADSLLGKEEGAAEEHMAEADAGPEIYYDLPEMLVNLNDSGRKSSFLKISVSLELENPAALELVDRLLPRIVDSFQIYLRELRIEDLNGSAGPMMLKEELLMRIHTATGAPMVRP